MKLSEIKERAKEVLEEKEADRLVGKYIDLLEMKKNTEKQLKNIEKAIKKYEEDPEDFCDINEDLW